MLSGIITGIVSGLFGIGGGTVLVPLLLLIGLSMKHAIGISIIQMVFGSILGSYLNQKKHANIIRDGLYLGLGGFAGGSLSGIIVANAEEIYLKYLFIAVVILAILKLISPASSQLNAKKNIKSKYSKISFLAIGTLVGLIAMSIGVGGAIMIIPLLITFLHFSPKEATSLSLFFVIFSSIAGLISHLASGHIMLHEGLYVALFSLVGVYFGVKFKYLIKEEYYKRLLLVLYVCIFSYMFFNIYNTKSNPEHTLIMDSILFPITIKISQV
jgi:uncharacterized membrane protein YfcA